MKITTFVLIAGIFFLCEISACTGIYLFRNGKAFFGSNEDYNLDYKAYFVPANPGKYGAVFFSWSDYYMQGGINEVGLSYDGFAANLKPIVNTAGKIIPSRGNGYTDPMQFILRNFETVPEALEVIRTWDLNSIGLDRAQLMIADRFGNAATIEGDSIIFIDGETLVTTNFYRSEYPDGRYPCQRYNTAQRLLNNSNATGVDLFKNVLNAVHQEGEMYTVYSYIGDLSNGTVYIYNKYNYEEVYSFNLIEELQKGYREVGISSFFSDLNISVPLNGASIDSSQVSFIWEANATSHRLFISENSEFSESIVVKIPESLPKRAGQADPFYFVLSVFLITTLLFKKEWKKTITILSLMTIISCSEDNPGVNEPEPILTNPDYKIVLSSNMVTVDYFKLNKGTEYFWKIECVNRNSYQTTSEVRKFLVK